MTELSTCKRCGRHYRADKLINCPRCGGDEHDSASEKQNPDDALLLRKDLAGLDELIQAQDRTTHAVRALAIFFFMNLFWTSGVVLLLMVANLIPSDTQCSSFGDCTKTTNGFSIFLYFVTFVVAVVGIIATIQESMKELLLSRVKPTRM